MAYIPSGAGAALPPVVKTEFDKCLDTWNRFIIPNREKDKYYNGDIALSEVNIGIALPSSFSRLSLGCHWGQSAVDVLAGHSIFEGFVGINGEPDEETAQIIRENALMSAYDCTVTDELKYGCTFATLSQANGRARIRFHSPETASAIWDGENQRLKCGFAVIDSITDTSNEATARVINFYTETDTWVLVRTNDIWECNRYPHKMGRPLMVAFRWNATHRKPLGQSRIKKNIRNLMQGYVRTMALATIGLEFATSPQKYLLGADKEALDVLVSDKFRAYIGSIIGASTNADGQMPVFGQLPQGTIQPHVDMLRMLSTQFSAASGLSVSDVGIVNDANPTSSEAIQAQTKTLIRKAQKLNQANGDALYIVIQMAMAINNRCTPEELTDQQKAVTASFRDPADPSTAQQADAAMKIASQRQSFAQTDVFLRLCGFSEAQIRQIKAQERQARGLEALSEVLTDGSLD